MALNWATFKKPSTGRKAFWPMAAPMPLGEVPMTPTGFSLKLFWPHGRLAQSIAFFRPPGMERLYSGVTIRMASASSIASFRARPSAG